MSAVFALVLASASPSLPPPTLAEHARTRLRHNLAGMSALGGWAAANLIGGAIAYGAAEPDSEEASFHQMNLAWGAINLGLAGMGIAVSAALIPRAERLDLRTSLRQGRGLGLTYAINAGIDVGYIGIGLTLALRQQGSALERGYGRALVLQGGFLLVFDAIMAAIMFAHDGRLMERVEWTGAGVRVRF